MLCSVASHQIFINYLFVVQLSIDIRDKPVDSTVWQMAMTTETLSEKERQTADLKWSACERRQISACCFM